VLVVAILTIATTSEASQSCMSKTEARRHFGSVHIYWHGADHCWDASSTRARHQFARGIERKIDKVDQPKLQTSGQQEARQQDADREDAKPQSVKPQSAMSPDSRQQDSRPQGEERHDSKPLASRELAARQLASTWPASMSQMTADDEPVQAPVQAPVQRRVQRSWADRWVDIKPAPLPLAERWVDIAPVTPPPNSSAADPELRMMVLGLVLVVVALMLAIVQVLFGAARGAGHRDQAVA
jgi:hypothetical protein